LTFSYNLVLALFLLAPGFAAFAGLFYSSHQQRHIHPAPPAPTSVLTLALVTLAALALHGAWATILFLQDLWAAQFQTIAVPFEPNIYVDLLRAGQSAKSGAPINGGEIAALLATLIGLSLAGYGLTVAVVSSKWTEARVRPLLYGWADDLVRQINEEEEGYVRLVTAFVLTSIEHEGSMFGYEGLLQNLSLTPDKELRSISLTQVTAFYVKLEPGRFKRIVLPRTKGIPDLYIPKDQIRNVSFTVFRVRDADEAIVDPEPTQA